MTETRWAELRQVGFAALDHAAAVRAATDLLGLGPGFGDPLLAELNLADFTAPIGPTPTSRCWLPRSPSTRWPAGCAGSAARPDGCCPPRYRL
jgi:hypothetical protein